MTTATQMAERDHAERDARIFELRMQDFFMQWSPDDPREKALFHSQLTSLIIQTYRDAQEPVLKQLTSIMAALPTLPILGSK